MCLFFPHHISLTLLKRFQYLFQVVLSLDLDCLLNTVEGALENPYYDTNNVRVIREGRRSTPVDVFGELRDPYDNPERRSQWTFTRKYEYIKEELCSTFSFPCSETPRYFIKF